MNASDQHRAIFRHVEQNIGRIHQAYDEIISDELRIQIIHVKSSLFRPYEVLVTAGMSVVPMSVPDAETPSRAEIVTILPKSWPLGSEAFLDERHYWPIRLMKDLARYPVHHRTWLGFGHTVANGSSPDDLAPYAPGIGFCAAILLPAPSLGEKAFCMKVPSETYFWTAVPLYAAELQFKLAQGADALLDLFDRAKVKDRIDPRRECAIRA